MYKIKQLNSDFIVREKIDLKIKESGEYQYFTLRKNGLNTLEAIFLISEKLKLPRKNFGYAGNKDKRAITEQAISIKTARDIGKIEWDKMQIEYLGKGDVPISLGMNLGNSFEIIARELDDEDAIEPCELMPNYFDEQRFSTKNVEIGLKLLKKDYSYAAQLIFSLGIADQRSTQAWEKDRSNPISALRMMDKKLLIMFIHSVQSLIFNETLSELIKRRSTSYKSLQYSMGEMAFPSEALEIEKLPVVGFGNEIEDEEVAEIINEKLSENGLTQRSFVIREFPELTSEGNERNAFAKISDLEIGEPEEDELNSGKKKCLLKFFLGKGSYATIAVKSMLG